MKQETPEDRVRLERKAQVYLPGEAVPWTVSSVVITGQETKMITQGIEQVTEMTLRLRRVVKVAKDE